MADTPDTASTPLAGRARHVTWLGHSGALLEDGDTQIIVDPVLSKHVGHLVRWEEVVLRPGREPDAAIITHAHHDHLDLPTLKRSLAKGNPIYAPAGADRVLHRAGFPNVITVTAGDTFTVDDVVVTVTPADHDGRRLPLPSTHPTEAVGYVVGEGDRSVYVAGDTALFNAMRDIGPVDVAMLPVAGWWRTLGPGHLDVDAAVEAASMIKPRLAIPVHWGTYRPVGTAKTMDPIRSDPSREFIERVDEFVEGTTGVLLQPGETWSSGD